MTATAGDYIRLIVTAAIVVGIIFGVVYAVDKINIAINETKTQLRKKGYNVSDKGLSVKTDKYFSNEDAKDSMQQGILKAWKASKFEVPWALQSTLGGTSHDKQKEEYEKKHGPRRHLKRPSFNHHSSSSGGSGAGVAAGGSGLSPPKK